MSTAPRPVVVGVDGSAVSNAALSWAADEASRRSAPLWVVHATDQQHSRSFVAANPEFVAEERRVAEEVVDTAIRNARRSAPDLDVRSVVNPCSPATVLIAQSVAADLVVVGSRGRGGFAGILLGSTSLYVAMHAYCPVVVLRSATGSTGAGSSAGRIVVGTDGSLAAERAVGFAFARARQRALGVTAVRALHSPAVYVNVPSSQRWEQLEKEEQAQLSEGLLPWREQYPEIDVVEKTVPGNAAAALIDESAGAELLVVGSHGRGGFGGLLLGSVSHSALHHAHCPVAVVRH